MFRPPRLGKVSARKLDTQADTALQSQSCCDGVSYAIQKHTEPAQPSTMTVFQLSTFIQRKGVPQRKPRADSLPQEALQKPPAIIQVHFVTGTFLLWEGSRPHPNPTLLSKSVIPSTCSHLLERCSGKRPSHRIFTGILVASPSIP